MFICFKCAVNRPGPLVDAAMRNTVPSEGQTCRLCHATSPCYELPDSISWEGDRNPKKLVQVVQQ